MNLEKNKDKKLQIALIIPIILLLSLLIIPFATNLLGETIYLQTKPYDPRDLFRGDYVTLRYEIEDVSKDKIKIPLGEINSLDKVYVSLVLNNDRGVYEVKEVTKKPPKNEIYIVSDRFYPDRNYDTNEIDSMRVLYDIDTYFVEENTGYDLEKASLKGEIIAEVKVFLGYPVLKEVRVKGEN